MVASKQGTFRRTLQRASVRVCLAIGALVIAAVGLQSTARAQRVDTVWYRVVNVNRNSGTMPRYQRLGEGYAGTFPFMDNFEISIRPQGGVIKITVRDGASRVGSLVSCTAPNAPRRSVMEATRTTQDSARITLDVLCSASEPPVQ
jgi:hypothetical protein